MHWPIQTAFLQSLLYRSVPLIETHFDYLERLQKYFVKLPKLLSPFVLTTLCHSQVLLSFEYPFLIQFLSIYLHHMGSIFLLKSISFHPRPASSPILWNSLYNFQTVTTLFSLMDHCFHNHLVLLHLWVCCALSCCHFHFVYDLCAVHSFPWSCLKQFKLLKIICTVLKSKS